MNPTRWYRPSVEVLEDRLPPGHLGGGVGHGPPDHAAAAAHANHNPGVLPSHSKSFGQSYGEWSADWWQWLYSMPEDQHPLFDTADCSEGQSGHVWFLGGTFTIVEENGEFVGTAERDCEVPAGTALFFPIVNANVNTIEEAADLSEEELRAIANFLADHITELSVTVDGKEIANLDSYRAESPLFVIGPLPENNVLGAEAGETGDAVADGIYLMLAPLPVGEHTIHFEGSAVFTEAEDGFDFVFRLDITYNITVVPPNG